MPNQKISNLTPKASALVATDLLEVSVYNGTTYDTRSVTGANVVSGLQPTLVSGTNIKTINSLSLLGSGNIVIGGGGLTVGTTAIASGTIGRILFEGTGNVVQQDNTLFWDNTNKRLGLGATPSTSVRLDVRAQGALSTDIALRVRNSADSANLFSVQGNNVVQLGALNINFPTLNFVSNVNPAITFLDVNGSNSGIKQYYQANGVVGSLLNESLTISKLGTPVGGNGEASRTNFINSTTNWGAYLGSAARGGFHFYFKNTDAIVEADRAFWITPDKRQLIYSKTADVVVGDVDAFAFYGQDIIAGNAAPHFRTENGAILKIYQETTAVAAATFVANAGTAVNDASTFDGYTLPQIVKALRNTGLLA